MAGKDNFNKKSDMSAKMVKKKRARGVSKKAPTLGQMVVESKNNTERPSLFRFTLIVLYKNLYILGITLMRRRLRYARKARRALDRLAGFLYGILHRGAQAAARLFVGLLRRAKAPFVRIRDTYRAQAPYIAQRKEQGQVPYGAYWQVLKSVGRLLRTVIVTLFNYAVPVVAAIALLWVVGRDMTRPLGLMLVYNGEEMGYLTNESVFDNAIDIVRDRIVDENVVDFTSGQPQYTLEAMPLFGKYLEAEDLADKIIQISGGEIEEAYGLYISSQFYGAVTDKDAILEELDTIRDENISGKRDERVEFIKSISLKPGYYPVNSMVPTENLLGLLRSNETVDEVYIVEEGDTPTGIADKTGIPYDQLKAMNPDIEDSMYTGTEIYTAVARPFLSVKSIFVDTYEEEFDYETIETENSLYAVSYRKVTQEGEEGLRSVTAEITTINGQEIEREVLSTQVIREAVPQRVTVGAMVEQLPAGGGSGGGGGSPGGPSDQVNPGGFIWPTTGGYATTYANHSGNGVDIAIAHGVPIYASKSGTVTKVVNGYTGYGRYVVIDHGDGYQTLYAHNSDIYVSVGDPVAQGQVIAAMGRTGWATGNHVHFEVHYMGRYMWPPDFIGYSA